MKCKICNTENRDTAKFCNECGAKLEPQLKACSNEDCPDYGKAILSAEAKFCPRCGYAIGGYVSNNNERNVVAMDKEVFTVEGVSFTMIAVQGGTYIMGASDNDLDARVIEKPAHKETVSDFMIGETPVTQELWQAVMCDNPSYFEGDMQRPVELVSWFDCQEFIRKLNQLTGQNFRLPAEAEWEYAARGGNRSKGYKYSGSNDVDAVAWYADNSGSTTHPVKTKQPNELGIYDMSGNVWEWCQDKWCDDYNSPHDSGYRVLRGGSWYDYAWSVRLSFRINYTPGDSCNYYGLRLAL